MEAFLTSLEQLSAPSIGLLFLLENIAVVVFVLVAGSGLQQKFAGTWHDSRSYSRGEWVIAAVTVLLNTAVTYAGFWLWQNGVIVFRFNKSLRILSDFFVLFMAMDLLMYIFHFMIHKTFLYNAIHQLHHQAIDPKPMDLFKLHPVETLSFGGLWLLLLLVYPFNLYAVIVYLFINVIFGMFGHLGIEPLPEPIRNNSFFRYLGSSTFHHRHHQDVKHNLGFYTTLWDRLFGTYSD